MKIYRLTVLLLLIISIALLVNGCVSPSDRLASYNTNSTSPINIGDVKALKAMAKQQSPIGQDGNSIRLKAIKQTALSFGAQTALAWRSQQLNNFTNQYQTTLDRIFNFRRLLIDNNILPPVLVKADNTLNLNNDTTIRLSGTVYKIIKQARFVTAPPNWRDYLFLNFQYPEIPNQTLLPKNDAENKLWLQYVSSGWSQGIRQANSIYLNNIAKLHRDITGIILYKKLLLQNIVSKPFVGKTNLGITTNDDDSALYLNDQVLRITALPKLNPDTKTWQPIIKADDEHQANK